VRPSATAPTTGVPSARKKCGRIGRKVISKLRRNKLEPRVGSDLSFERRVTDMEPGFYWARDKRTKGWSVVEIVRFGPGPKEITVYILGGVAFSEKLDELDLLIPLLKPSAREEILQGLSILKKEE
jgi:hypothetical protein